MVQFTVQAKGGVVFNMGNPWVNFRPSVPVSRQHGF